MRFEVPMAVTGEYILWNVGPCYLVEINQSSNEVFTTSTFGKTETVCSSEMLIDVLKL
jgi:hypothetical protein